MTSQTETSPTETRAFEADVARLLHLMVHSVYSSPDVFLRELISNAADACEKLRQMALTDASLTGGDTLAIEITPDKDAARLIIADNGVGMTREELIENLGTMARSGTEKFRKALEEKDSAEAESGKALIGQFGVGFYSAFMVASEVTVTSRAAGGGEAWRWTSDGSGEFTVAPAEDAPARGTSVELTLREDHKDYADEATIERLVRHHSAHVPVPIKIRTTGEDGAETRELVDGTALWAKPKSEITAEEYTDFYRFTAGAFDEPALTVHARVEGRQEYTCLLFVPSMQPFDLFDPDRKGRLKLYVRRVFITDDADLVPPYLRFVRGLVDSEDLPLNLSREMLQTNPMLTQMKSALTRRLLTEMKKLADTEPETYAKVWDAFGAVMKEGLYEDAERRDELFALARFRTTTQPDGGRKLADYVADMKENQTAIYYAVGDSFDRLTASPHLEGFKARGIEVLLLADPVDAFWVRTALGFDGKPFKSVTQGSADLDQIPLTDQRHVPDEAKASDIATLSALIKQTLGERVSEVKTSTRLATSPACLVASDMGYDRQLEKIVGRQGQGLGAKPILELNPSHPLIKTLSARAATGGAADVVGDTAWLLFGAAQIMDGESPTDSAEFTDKLVTAMAALVRSPAPTDHADSISTEGSEGGESDAG
ncbi:molecular chaperone HtpG [Acuticoccus sp. I52.16.1]|uniref:molecular chaperone HtpG n=1 Tax=Acuticoccus sp. I52.16.1 TaxID=2928472 RepID=UPI001FD4481B|nr:molecular chaperone HtpG [Acuticoccus sp. I52.16.1]UOM33579.1 molecular chaperone HtpG [Acuticoccus sp. I52.16.1]